MAVDEKDSSYWASKLDPETETFTIDFGSTKKLQTAVVLFMSLDADDIFIFAYICFLSLPTFLLGVFDFTPACFLFVCFDFVGACPGDQLGVSSKIF